MIRRTSTLLLVVLLTAAASGEGMTPPQPQPLPWLGMTLSWRLARAQRLLLVERVVPQGPAGAAGVLPGDILQKIGGTPVDFGDQLDFLLFLGKHKPGERLPITIVRSGRPQNVVVVVGTMPESSRASWERALQTSKRERSERRAARE